MRGRMLGIYYMIKRKWISMIAGDFSRKRLHIRARGNEDTFEMPTAMQARENANTPREYQYERNRQIQQKICLGRNTDRNKEEE